MEHNFAGKISAFFNDNRPLSFLVLFGTVFAGFFGYVAMPKQYNPEIILPAFEVFVEYPGATAEEVEQYVTEELEEKISDISGVDEISSRSVDGGMSVVVVRFEVGEDLEEAKVKLFTQLEENVDLQIGSIGKPIIKNINPDDVPILTFALISDRMPYNELRKKAFSLSRALKDVPETANIEVHGGETRALRIELMPDAMVERNVDVSEIIGAIQSSNAVLRAGSLENEQTIVDVLVDGRIDSEEIARNVFVKDGVRLRDVANIADAYAERVSYASWYESVREQPAVFLSIAKRKGSNAPAVSKSVRAAFEKELASPEYAGIEYVVARDDGKTASNAIRGLGVNLLTSIVIVGAVLYVFLGLRSSLVVMVAIPMTLLLVFFFGNMYGQTVNRITLFALILSLGLLVDSATVVVENIYRHLKNGDEDSNRVVPNAVHEIGMGLLLSTVTSVVVFVPMKFITGMMGPYMGPLAFFVPMALIMSFFVAIIITPFLSRLILKKDDAPAPAEHVFNMLSEIYANGLRTILHNSALQKKMLSGALVALLVALSFPVLKLVHFKMLPPADKEQFYIYIDMREGTDLEATHAYAQSVVSAVLDHSEVESVQSFVGLPAVSDFNGLFKGSYNREASHLATLKVNLTDPDDRSVSSMHVVSEMRAHVNEVAPVPSGGTLKFVEDPPGPPVLSTFVAKVQSDSYETRTEFARMLAGIIGEIDGFVDMDDGVESGYARATLRVNHQKASDAGISVRDIVRTVSTVSDSAVVSQYHVENGREFSPIEIGVADSDKDELRDIGSLRIRSASGALVPIASVTETRIVRQEPVIYADEGKRTTYVTAEMEHRSIVYGVIDTISALHRYTKASDAELADWNLFHMTFKLASGETVTVEWGGEWKMTLENFRDLGIAMGVAFLFVYGVLVAQFRSFSIPGLIMMTVPFGLVGILPGFAIMDAIGNVYLTATALIGFIALIGIVVNNAILYIEYFNALRDAGTSVVNALIEAGKVRMRPIVLTSMTTVLGSLTIAFDPVWSGLAWSIVFGLSLSAIMTLIIFPILYVTFVEK